jgi:hypothetical protein
MIGSSVLRNFAVTSDTANTAQAVAESAIPRSGLSA